VATRRRKAIKARTVIERTKTSISLLPEAKYRLSTLKAELRRKGQAVSESEILESLILHTDAATVARLVKG